jgi:nucleotide-binding universal stress UspA family protein
MISFKKILFPTDFSPAADQALHHAVRLAGFSRSEVIVQHVVSNYFDNLWNHMFDLRELKDELDRYVTRNMAEIVQENAQMTFRQVISKGRPAEEIVALADEEMVDLIVMGSAGGAITGKVIRLARQPVLAVTTNGATVKDGSLEPLNTILVATDLSAYSARVIEYAFNLKEALAAQLYMLHVIETPGSRQFGGLDKMKEWAVQKMIGLTPNAFVSDSDVIRVVETGPISERIAQVAADIHADITIVGTHAYGDVHRQVMGTTTDALLSKASSPILALKL